MRIGLDTNQLRKNIKSLEEMLIPAEIELRATTEVWEKYGDYAHQHMVVKLTEFVTPIRQEYDRLRRNYPIENYPEVWL